MQSMGSSHNWNHILCDAATFYSLRLEGEDVSVMNLVWKEKGDNRGKEMWLNYTGNAPII